MKPASVIKAAVFALFSHVWVHTCMHVRACVHLCLLAMVELDGDDIRISSRGKLAERDIVQVTLLLCSLW